MSTVTFAFYKGRKSENAAARIFDRLVTWWPRSKGRFSHCELVTSDGYGWSSSWRDGGVRRKAIDFGSGRWVLVTVPDAELPLGYADAIQWYEQHRGARYDVFGILGFVLPFRLSYRRWYFCTESIATAFGLDDPHRCHPNRLYAWCMQRQGALSSEPSNHEEIRHG